MFLVLISFAAVDVYL